MEELVKQIEREFNGKYEFYNYNHALEILSNSFLDEWNEIKNALHGLQITVDELLLPGGNESPIPPKFNEMLEPLGWQGVEISGDLIVRIYPRKRTFCRHLYKSKNDFKLY